MATLYNCKYFGLSYKCRQVLNTHRTAPITVLQLAAAFPTEEILPKGSDTVVAVTLSLRHCCYKRNNELTSSLDRVLNSRHLGINMPKIEPLCPNFKTRTSQTSSANCFLLYSATLQNDIKVYLTKMVHLSQ